MVLVLSIKDGYYKIEKSIFWPNYGRYEKMLRSKIVHLKKIYKFGFDHFFRKTYGFYFNQKNVVKGMLQVDHVIKPVLRSIFLFSTYKN